MKNCFAGMALMIGAGILLMIILVGGGIWIAEHNQTAILNLSPADLQSRYDREHLAPERQGLASQDIIVRKDRGVGAPIGRIKKGASILIKDSRAPWVPLHILTAPIRTMDGTAFIDNESVQGPVYIPRDSFAEM